jgi:hypothetical protein
MFLMVCLRELCRFSAKYDTLQVELVINDGLGVGMSAILLTGGPP